MISLFSQKAHALMAFIFLVGDQMEREAASIETDMRTIDCRDGAKERKKSRSSYRRCPDHRSFPFSHPEGRICPLRWIPGGYDVQMPIEY